MTLNGRKKEGLKLGGKAGMIFNYLKTGQNGDLLFVSYLPLGAERTYDEYLGWITQLTRIFPKLANKLI